MHIEVSWVGLWWLLGFVGALAVIWLVPFRIRRAGTDGEDQPSGVVDHLTTEDATMKVTDAVCGMEFDAERPLGQTEYNEETYYFCSEACKRQFEADPQRYVGPTETV